MAQDLTQVGMMMVMKLMMLMMVMMLIMMLLMMVMVVMMMTMSHRGGALLHFRDGRDSPRDVLFPPTSFLLLLLSLLFSLFFIPPVFHLSSPNPTEAPAGCPALPTPPRSILATPPGQPRFPGRSPTRRSLQ